MVAKLKLVVRINNSEQVVFEEPILETSIPSLVKFGVDFSGNGMDTVSSLRTSLRILARYLPAKLSDKPFTGFGTLEDIYNILTTMLKAAKEFPGSYLILSKK